MAPIVPRWEWRTFARSVRADAVFDALVATTVDESDEVYLLAAGGDNVKVRHGLVDVKVLRETDAAGLQRWEPILKAPFPLDAGTARTVLQGLRRPPPALPTDGLSLDDLVAAAGVGEPGGVRVVPVRKQRHRYTSRAARPSARCSRSARTGRPPSPSSRPTLRPSSPRSSTSAWPATSTWTSRPASAGWSTQSRSATPSSTPGPTRPSSTSRSAMPTVTAPGARSSTERSSPGSVKAWRRPATSGPNRSSAPCGR